MLSSTFTAGPFFVNWNYTGNRLSKNFHLSIASSVDSNQSNPSVSLSSFRVSITFLKVGSFFIAHIHCRVLFSALFCKQEEERSRLSRGPHFLNLRSLRTH